MSQEQKAEENTTSEKTDNRSPGPYPSVDPVEVAEKVYHLMKRDLRIERERILG